MTTTTKKPINVKELNALLNCQHFCSADFNEKNDTDEKIEKILSELPHGSGINSGMTFLPLESENEKKIVFLCPYHHLNENGYYDGWTNYKVVITAIFGGIDIKIIGKNKNGTKEYLSDLMYETFE